MMENRGFSRGIKTLLFCLACFLHASAAFSFPYQPVQALHIQTELSNSANTFDRTTVRNWTVKPAEEEGASNSVVFYPEGEDRAICRIAVSASGRPAEWICDLEISQLMRAEDLLIVPGFPAPCDVLPVNLITGQAAEAGYEIKRKAGGRVFVSEIDVSVFPVSPAQAKENGWLRDGLSAAGPLRMIQAVNKRSGDPVVRQLWPAGGSWWVYEETEFRRSWRLP